MPVPTHSRERSGKGKASGKGAKKGPGSEPKPQTWEADDAVSGAWEAAKPESVRRKQWPTSTLPAAELLVAVRSLYENQAMPQEPLLVWWLSRQLGSKFTADDLRAAAAELSEVEVRSDVASGKKSRNLWFALLDPPAGFAGFKDDPSSEAELSVAVVDVAAEHAMKGGWPAGEAASYDRYELASWLRGQHSELGRLSFGQSLGLVNMMVGSHSVLGKRNGRLVPYTWSEEFEKQENARLCVPTGLREGEAFVASWPELLKHLAVLILESGGSISPARLKLGFRDRFRLELSETALGYTTLGNLLTDERLNERFELIKAPDGRSEPLLRIKERPLPAVQRSEAKQGRTPASRCKDTAPRKDVASPPRAKSDALSVLQMATPQRSRDGHCLAEHHATPQKTAEDLQPKSKDHCKTQVTATAAAANAAAVALLRPTFSLPDWCIVRRTFIDTLNPADETASSRRAFSTPPWLLSE